MPAIEDTILFPYLAVGDRFRLMLGRQLGHEVYTKILPREDNGIILNAESEGMVAHIPDDARVVPVLSEEHVQLFARLGAEAHAQIITRAHAAGFDSVERFICWAVSEALKAAGVPDPAIGLSITITPNNE